VTRSDAAIAAVVVALAATARFWNLGALGLTHFDEGAYAQTALWLATLGGEGAGFQPVFSPPLFPAVAGLAMALFGASDTAAIGASAAAGSLTVGLVYAIGRAWLSRAEAAAAALMLAAAEYHLVYSRAALTDATFALLFWAALACLYRAVETDSRRWFVAGGLATGLCWNTKYHGFLPLAIVAVWVALGAARRARAPVRGLAAAAGIAVACYLPWAIAVEATIGYGALVATHASHSIGRGWPVTPPAALAFYLGRWLAAPLVVLATVGATAALVERREAPRFVLLVTIVFLGAATCYLGFPRLVLPVVPALCLLAASGLAATARALRVSPAATVAAGTALVLVLGAPRAAALLRMRTDAYRQAARYVLDAGVPAVTQMSKNYYFYDGRSVELRFSAPEPEGEVLVAVDPVVERLPEAKAWVDRIVGDRTPERVFPIEMYEPFYYQGFDPTAGLDAVPREVAPFRPGEARIAVYRIVRE
jgi:4-amino-4-deoxy-L-arabinose transferase-like glycosyltransferase